MQSILNRAQPVQLVLDTDMLTDCDDLAALGMLHTLESMGEARLLAVTVSSREPRSAPVVDAVNTYYGRPDIPVGAPKKWARCLPPGFLLFRTGGSRISTSSAFK